MNWSGRKFKWGKPNETVVKGSWMKFKWEEVKCRKV